MIKTKLAMLGTSGSGKTSFILGLNNEMKEGVEDFTFETKDEVGQQLKAGYEIMRQTTKGERNGAAATSNQVTYKFELKYQFLTIGNIHITDYKGGLIEEKTDSLKEYKEILEDIKQSNVLSIILDGDLLIKGDLKKKIARVRDKCSRHVNSFISKYVNNGERELPPIAIIITKSDKCSQYITEKDTFTLVKEVFGALFSNSKGKRRIVAVIPVSVGKESKDGMHLMVQRQDSVHLPVFFGMWVSYVKRIYEIENGIAQNKENENQEKMEETSAKPKTKIHLGLDKSKGKKLSIKELLQTDIIVDIKKTEEVEEIAKEEVVEDLSDLKEKCDAITNILEDVKFVFCNGEKTKFDELYKIMTEKEG